MADTNVNPTFAVNDFDNPRVLSTLESFVTDVLMILFGRPGFYPSIPSLGMNIQQYMYKFDDEVSTEDLKVKLAKQCDDFSDTIDTGNLDVVSTKYKGNLMLIFILPVINDSKEVQLSLGITTNTRGEIVYNFVENVIQKI